MTDLQSGLERRAVPRFSLSILIEYETPSGWAPLGETFDLSERGLGVKLNKPSKLPSSLRWRSPEAQIQALGRVAWQDLEQNRCGVQLLEIDELSKFKLSQKLHLLPEVTLLKIQSIKSSDPIIHDFFKKTVFEGIKTLDKILRSPLMTEKEKQSEVNALLDGLVANADTVASKIQQKTVRLAVESTFRELLGPWIYQSSIMKRATEKPRGYPGDFIMLETIYNDQLVSSGDGKYFDFYFLQNPYAIAVKNRKDQMREILLDLISKSKRNLKILNIACGPCREIKELVSFENSFKVNAEFFCVDHDDEALAWAKNSIHPVTNKIQLNYIQESILNFIKKPDLFAKKLGLFDLIYSIGLVDYLPDKILKALLAFLLNLLNEKAVLIISHKDIDQYKPLPPNWYCDWHFISRNEPQILTLFQEAAPFPIKFSLTHEKSNKIFFVSISRS